MRHQTIDMHHCRHLYRPSFEVLVLILCDVDAHFVARRVSSIITATSCRVHIVDAGSGLIDAVMDPKREIYSRIDTL